MAEGDVGSASSLPEEEPEDSRFEDGFGDLASGWDDSMQEPESISRKQSQALSQSREAPNFWDASFTEPPDDFAAKEPHANNGPEHGSGPASLKPTSPYIGNTYSYANEEVERRDWPQETDNLEAEYEERKARYEEEWDELELEREAANKELKEINAKIDSEKQAFIQWQAAEKSKTMAEIDEMMKKAHQERHEDDQEWLRQLDIEKKGLQKAKELWQLEYAEQRVGLEEEKEQHEKDLDEATKKMEKAIQKKRAALQKEDEENRAKLDKQIVEERKAMMKQLEEGAKRQTINRQELEARTLLKAKMLEQAAAIAQQQFNDVKEKETQKQQEELKGIKAMKQKAKSLIQRSSQHRELVMMECMEAVNTHQEDMKRVKAVWQEEQTQTRSQLDDEMAKWTQKLQRTQKKIQSRAEEQGRMFVVDMELQLDAQKQLLDDQRNYVAEQTSNLEKLNQEAAKEAMDLDHSGAVKRTESEEGHARFALATEENELYQAFHSQFLDQCRSTLQREHEQARLQLDTDQKALASAMEATKQEHEKELQKYLSDLKNKKQSEVGDIEKEMMEARQRLNQTHKEQQDKLREEVQKSEHELKALKDDAQAWADKKKDREEQYEREKTRMLDNLEAEWQRKKQMDHMREILQDQKSKDKEKEAALRKQQEEDQAMREKEYLEQEAIHTHTMQQQGGRWGLFSQACADYGLLLGTEKAEWEVLMQQELEWRPSVGKRWLANRVEKLLKKEELQRDKLSSQWRDFKNQMAEAIKEDRRQVEKAIREKKQLRPIKKLSALQKIRGKASMQSMAAERPTMSTVTAPRMPLPALEDVAALVNASSTCPDPRELSAYKSYFAMQLQDILKPTDPTPFCE